MPSADALITRDGPVAVPMDYPVPAASAMAPLVVTASFDGSAAASAFLPTLEVIAPTGAVVARCPVATQVAAGGSADVSWFPRVGGGGVTQIIGNPNLLAARTLAADATEVVFSGFSTAYHSLQLTATVRTDRVAPFDALGMQYNGDTAANYGWNQVTYPTDAGINLGNTIPDTAIYCGECCASQTSSAAFSVIDLVIGGYTNPNTQKFSTSRWADTKYPTAVMVVGVNGGEYNVAAAIASIRLFSYNGANLLAGSTFVLYGL